MDYQFRKHYTRDEARALLPQVRQWLDQLADLRGRARQTNESLSPILEKGYDAGGELVNTSIRVLAQVRDILREFQTREIQLKDLERGLIDFPAFVAGREVFLCWEKDEEDIEYWHDLSSGYAGRERL